MYRNLEEGRRTPMSAADDRAAVECHCPCKAPAESGQEKKPAGDQAGIWASDYFDRNGKYPET